MPTISKTCEVDALDGPGPCGRPSVAGYATQSGGFFTECEEHAARHTNISLPIADIEAVKLLKDSAVQIPQPRGPLMNARDVASQLFSGKVSSKWVKQNVPNRVKLGHSTVLWYRDDVLAFIEQQREVA